MKRRPPKHSRSKQIVSEDLMGNLLAFLQTKFYQGHPDSFAKDRKRLLEWVVLWPAKWLDERGVTLPPERYRQIFMDVFLDGIRFGDVGKIAYLPAWLGKVIQSHYDHHEDEIYDEAKSIRLLSEQAVTFVAGLERREADPVRELAQAAKLLKAARRPSKLKDDKAQLNLL